MQDFADWVLLISRSGRTRLVERAEKEGLVTPEHFLQDRRVVFAVITSKRKTMLQRAMAGHRHSIEQHFLRHLSDEEAHGLQVALAKVPKA